MLERVRQYGLSWIAGEMRVNSVDLSFEEGEEFVALLL